VVANIYMLVWHGHLMAMDLNRVLTLKSVGRREGGGSRRDGRMPFETKRGSGCTL